MICENKSCTYHLPLPLKDAWVSYVTVSDNLNPVRVNRHLYRWHGVDIFLCDVCHRAVQGGDSAERNAIELNAPETRLTNNEEPENRS